VSGTALDHWLVRGYLAELDAALGGLPAAQARELKEQITAHLDDALGPDAGDQEVAATLSRLGSPADLAAEAGAASGPPGRRFARSTRRTRWRLAVIIAIPLVTAATLGALRISSEASSYAAAGRDQRLARLDVAVVTLSRDLEDERDLSGAYAARRQAGPIPPALSRARMATDAAAGIVRADAAGIGAGYPPAAVHAVADLLAGIADLRTIRAGVSSSPFPPSQLIRIYTFGVIGPADTFAAAVGDTRLQATATSLAALLRVENDQSLQRAIVYAALTARPPVLASEDLLSLQQAAVQEHSDLAAFNSSAGPVGQQLFSRTVSGNEVDVAASTEIQVEQVAAARPSAPLTPNIGMDAAEWYRDKSTTIDDTRQVTGHLVSQVSGQADTARSRATRDLLFSGIATLIVLLVLVISAVLARPLRG
jgi:Nitrate and nitrite sensing/HAAS